MIYLVTFYYPPEGTPGANRFSHLARILTARHGTDNVRVVTGRPNYPHGRLPPEFKWRLFKRTTGKWGEAVDHLYEIPAAFEGLYHKTLGMVSFAVSLTCYLLFRRYRPDDLVIVTSGPVFAAYAVWTVSRLRRFPYIVDVRDLWPQIVAGMGFLRRDGTAYRLLMRLSDAVYRDARRAIGTTEGICDYLRSVAPGTPVELVYNPVDMRLFQPTTPESRAALRRDRADVYGQDNETVFLFSGSFSVTINPLQVLQAAALAARQERFRLVMIGYGEQREEMERFVDENGLAERVRFLPFMPREELMQHIGAADASLSCTRDDPINRIVIPTKVIEYLACDKFLILALDCPFADKLRDEGLALTAPPEDARALAGRMVEFALNRNTLIRPGVARRFAEDHFAMEKFEERMLAALDPATPHLRGL